MDAKQDFGSSRGSHKATQEVMSASHFLLERLQESRTRHARPKRGRQSDFGPQTTTGRDDDIFLNEATEGSNATVRLYDSSPLAKGSGGSRPRTLGAKELDQQMDQLKKANFDLKLELDHRRAYQAKLQAENESMRDQMERVALLREEHVELLRINSQLVEELEGRDAAIKEAADLICELEEKLEDMQERTITQTIQGMLGQRHMSRFPRVRRR
jgi:hypothetical protein